MVVVLCGRMMAEPQAGGGAKAWLVPRDRHLIIIFIFLYNWVDFKWVLLGPALIWG